MAFKTSLAAVRYYTDFDPYYYTVDNRPLTDLHDREDAICDELDRRTYIVDVSGAVTPTVNSVPTGWTVSRSSIGVYVITHTFGSTGYAVFPSIVNSVGGFIFTTALTSNSFTINTTSTASALADFRFQLLVSRYL